MSSSESPVPMSLRKGRLAEVREEAGGAGIEAAGDVPEDELTE